MQPETLSLLNQIYFGVACILCLGALYNGLAHRLKHRPNGNGRLPVLEAGELAFSEKTFRVLLLLILAVGLFLRLWQFGIIPGGFNQDGAMAAVDGKALADYGTDRFGTWLPAHLYAWGYGQMSSLLSYLIALFVKVFDLSVITARLPQLLASVMGGIFFYLFMKENFGKPAGLIGALFVAVNPWHFLQSRWALDCNLLPHFFMGGLYFLSRGIRTKTRYLLISMIFFALCMYCYGIAIYTIPFFLIVVGIFYLVTKKITIKELLICAGVYLLIAWPFLLTMAVNYFHWDTIELPFVTIQNFSESSRSSGILLFTEEPLQQLVKNVQHLLNTTIAQKKDLTSNDIEGFGTMYLCTMPFFFVGFVQFVKIKSNGTKGLALFALLTGVWAGLITNNVNVNRINIIYYGMMMFSVLGICLVVTQLKKLRVSVLAIYAVLAILFTQTYFTTYAAEIGAQFYDGFGEAVAAAEASGTQRIYVTADVQAEGRWKLSEILTLFYDKTDAQYFQGKTNFQHGKEWWPYNQRFIYVSMSAEVVERTKQEDTSYVIREADAVYFDPQEYEIQTFEKFCAVTKRE